MLSEIKLISKKLNKTFYLDEIWWLAHCIEKFPEVRYYNQILFKIYEDNEKLFWFLMFVKDSNPDLLNEAIIKKIKLLLEEVSTNTNFQTSLTKFQKELFEEVYDYIINFW
jgi:hypothetical protein